MAKNNDNEACRRRAVVHQEQLVIILSIGAFGESKLSVQVKQQQQ